MALAGRAKLFFSWLGFLDLEVANGERRTKRLEVPEILRKSSCLAASNGLLSLEPRRCHLPEEVDSEQSAAHAQAIAPAHRVNVR